MTYRQDISRAFAEAVGEHGAEQGVYAQSLARASEGVALLRLKRDQGALPVLALSADDPELDRIEAAARRIRESCTTLVVIGMGGSSLSGEAFTALAQNPFAAKKNAVQVHYVDNIDPHSSDRLIGSLDFAQTMFLAVSKSGNTAETLSNLLILIGEASSRLGEGALRDHFLVISEESDNPMRRIAAAHSLPCLDHHPNIGGRFASLTSVGLLPAAVAGLDIRAIRRGAAEVARQCFSDLEPEPAKGAAIGHALLERAKNLCVLMPYCDRLRVFSAWWQQIWAESLGKDGRGITPLRSLGAVDQHSHLQLYLDGPRDKFVTLLFLDQAGKGGDIRPPADPELAYLGHRSLGDLMEAEQRATAESLTHKSVPTRIFTLPELNEEALGALMMHFMLETMIMAHLLSVDAFNQPAVEHGKRIAREFLLKMQ